MIIVVVLKYCIPSHYFMQFNMQVVFYYLFPCSFSAPRRRGRDVHKYMVYGTRTRIQYY